MPDHDAACESTRARIYRRTETPCACADRAAGYTTWQPTGGHSGVDYSDTTGPAPWEWATREKEPA